MKFKFSFTLLALFMSISAYSQVVRYSSLSEVSGLPYIILFDDDSEDSRILYQHMNKLSTKVRDVSFMVINYNNMSDKDKIRAKEKMIEGPSSFYIAWDILDGGCALNKNFDLKYLKPLLVDLAELHRGIRLYRDGKYKIAKKKFVKIFGSKQLFFPEAALYAGLCFQTERKFDIAANYFSEAGRLGLAEGLYQTGYYYETGKTSAGVQIEMARVMYEKASRMGHERATIRLAGLRP